MDNKYRDLATLITAAGKAGVMDLEIEGIVVKYFRPRPIGGVNEAVSSPAVVPASVGEDFSNFPTALMTSPAEPSQEQVTSLEDRGRLEQQEYDQLMLDDPSEFEQRNVDLLMGNSVYA